MITDFAQHSQRVQDMADRLNVDLAHAVLSGKLRRFPYEDVVARCSRCAAQEACNAWLKAASGTTSHAPDYCRNKHLFEGLQA